MREWKIVVEKISDFRYEAVISGKLHMYIGFGESALQATINLMEQLEKTKKGTSDWRVE